MSKDALDEMYDADDIADMRDELRIEQNRIVELETDLDRLRNGHDCILPQTRGHAQNLYTVALACLKTFGHDIEGNNAAIIARLADENAKFREALENVALLDEADGHLLNWEHALDAVAIATKTLGKHPSEIFQERCAAKTIKGGPTS